MNSDKEQDAEGEPSLTENENKLDNPLTEYRRWLVAAEQKAQESFDKAVLALSGGGLGISLVFLRDVIGQRPIERPCFLLAAWFAWGLSAVTVLTSHYLSQKALRHAIVQVDDGTIYDYPAGGWLATATEILNAAGGILFLLGVGAITFFASANISI